MTDLLAGLARLILRLLLIAAGLLFVVSLMLALLVVAVFWALRAAWAVLRGRPVMPMRARFDPRAGFGRVYRAADGWGARRGQGRGRDDVTDVEARPIDPQREAPPAGMAAPALPEPGASQPSDRRP